MSVSIILPNYNHSNFLQKRLDSIFNQTYKNYEVIILDDSSTDNSLEILNEYRNHPKVSHFVVNEINSGSPFIQWNKGIQLAKGDFVWIAESDDYAEITFLEKLLPRFDEKTSIVYCQSYRVMADGRGNGDWVKHTREFTPNIFENDFSMEGHIFIEKYLIHKNVIPNVSAVIWKKSDLDRIIPLNFTKSMKLNADWYFYLQVLLHSKIYFVSDRLNFFRYHEKSLIAETIALEDPIRQINQDLLARYERLEYIKSNPYINRDNIIIAAKKTETEIKKLKLSLCIKHNDYSGGLEIFRNDPSLRLVALKLLLIKKPIKNGKRIINKCLNRH